MAAPTTALRIVEGSSMDKTKALSAALSQIERQFGKGAVMKMNAQAQIAIAAVSTGSLSLSAVTRQVLSILGVSEAAVICGASGSSGPDAVMVMVTSCGT